MSRSPRALRRLAVVAVVTATLGAPVPVLAAGTDEPTDGTLLAEADNGTSALRELGEDVDLAASRNDLTAVELTSLLRTDETAWLDTDGRIYYVEPADEDAPSALPATSGSPDRVAPLDQTFELHSRPGASRTIFLDVDGANVSGTRWNVETGIAARQPGWDSAGNGPSFSDSERVAVQQVWAIVAEDFAPFDVDVTTEDPGTSGPGASSYGSHVLITSGTDAHAKLCKSSCGGIAYIDVFRERYYQPAWVFTRGIGNSSKNVAEAASHEVGHNLGLDHHGAGSKGYYGGHGVWAPIMGVGYDKPVTQWSRGDYPGANNAGQDDLRRMRSHLALRADEDSGSVPALTAEPAYITSAGDADTWDLGTCSVGTTVTVSPAGLAPDLDVSATLRDAADRVVATDAPASGRGNGVTASGMGASLVVPGDGAGWTLTVDGVGQGTWDRNGYDDYGSLGAYTVSAPGCSTDDVETAEAPPGAPEAVRAVAGDSRATVRWSRPPDGAAASTYVVTSTRGVTVEVPGSATSAVVRELRNGTPQSFTVRAENAAGSSAESLPSAEVVPAGVPRATGRPALAVRHRSLTVRWIAPDANGADLTRYRVSVAGLAARVVPGDRQRLVMRRLAPGRYRVTVAAENAVGLGSSSRVATVRIRP